MGEVGPGWLADGVRPSVGVAVVEVPFARIDPAARRRLMEEFVTRDGTDYGGIEKTLEEKVAALVLEIESGEAAIVYETASATIDIVARCQRRQHENGGQHG